MQARYENTIELHQICMSSARGNPAHIASRESMIITSIRIISTGGAICSTRTIEVMNNLACQRVDFVSFCFVLFRLTSLVLSLLLLPVCGRRVYENKQTNMAGVEVFDISSGSSGRDSFEKRSKFPWNERLSALALREIYFEKPYQYVAGTPESATAWRTIFTRLNENYPNVFPETVEKVRDHVRGILKKRATVVRELEKQSGIVEEETEFKTLMDDNIAERDDYLGQHTVKKEKEKKDEEAKERKGKDCRLKAMETLGDTKKRKVGGRLARDEKEGTPFKQRHVRVS